MDEFRKTTQARLGAIKWSKTTQEIMHSYRLRWNGKGRQDEPEEVVKILIDLWDRLVMYPDDSNARLGLAQVGMEFVFSLQYSSHISGEPLPEMVESLGGHFYEIRAGRRVSYEITNAAGEKRKLTFERGERTITLPGGDPVPLN